MKYRTERQYIVVVDDARSVGLPPFILAEIAGVEIEREPALILDGRVVDYSRIDDEARQVDIPGSVLSRKEVDADPDLRRALERWQSGDDTPAAEYERLELIAGSRQDLENATERGFLEKDGTLEVMSRYTDDAEAHGPIFVDA